VSHKTKKLQPQHKLMVGYLAACSNDIYFHAPSGTVLVTTQDKAIVILPY